MSVQLLPTKVDTRFDVALELETIPLLELLELTEQAVERR